MAKFAVRSNDKVYSIKKFLGVNENLDGDTNLKMGEASNMQNFKITDNNALQVRGGTKNIAGLLHEYQINVAEETVVVETDYGVLTSSFTVYPNISVSNGGVLMLSGESVSIDSTNIDDYAGHYWKNSVTGLIYKIGNCSISPTDAETATAVTGGYINISTEEKYLRNFRHDGVFNGYSNVEISASQGLTLTGDVYTDGGDYLYRSKYISLSNNIYRPSKTVWLRYVDKPNDGGFTSEYAEYGYLVTNATKWEWNFYPVTAETNSNDTIVRGIWSGRVGDMEYIVAACNGYLWKLTETDSVWSKAQIGVINTTKPVHMFGFDGKLYILDGEDYKVWDGDALTSVTGYVPLISVSNVPSGGGTHSTGKQAERQAQSVVFPDGTATTFQLPETGVASIDYVKKTSDGTAVTFTADKATGVVTISPGFSRGCKLN